MAKTWALMSGLRMFGEDIIRNRRFRNQVIDRCDIYGWVANSARFTVSGFTNSERGTANRASRYFPHLLIFRIVIPNTMTNQTIRS